MSHALMYHGGFDQNRPGLAPGTRTFQGSDGSERVLPDWPRDARGARIGYMEKSGKKFVAVRVLDDEADIVLGHEVLLDPPRHMGYGKRFGAEPTLIQDDTARAARGPHRAEPQAARGADRAAPPRPAPGAREAVTPVEREAGRVDMA